MLDPLLSRFVIVNIEKYSYAEFKEVGMKVLLEREHLDDENLAISIVNEVWQKNSDKANIRNIINVARLAKNLHDVDLVSRTVLS